MKCIHCGNDLSPNSVFCPTCGHSVQKAPQQQVNQQQPRQQVVQQPQQVIQQQVVQRPQQQVVRQPQQQAVNQQTPPPSVPPKKSRPPKKDKGNVALVLVIVFLIIVVFALSAAIGYVIFQNNNPSDDGESDNASQNSTYAISFASSEEVVIDHVDPEDSDEQDGKDSDEQDVEDEGEDTEKATEEKADEDEEEEETGETKDVRDDEPTKSDGYLYPSNTNYISRSYLDTLTKEEVALIRNEIYARRGYIFSTEPYKTYFSEKSWYTPNPDFDASMFNEIETTNRDVIIAYEKEKGWK